MALTYVGFGGQMCTTLSLLVIIKNLLPIDPKWQTSFLISHKKEVNMISVSFSYTPPL